MANEYPISIYSIVHTGANIQLGGLKMGFSIVKYHVLIESFEARLEIKPIAKQIAIDVPSFVMLARVKLLIVS